MVELLSETTTRFIIPSHSSHPTPPHPRKDFSTFKTLFSALDTLGVKYGKESQQNVILSQMQIELHWVGFHLDDLSLYS